MDSEGRIYQSTDLIAEDKARLDGYLRARAEQSQREQERDELEALRAKVARLEGDNVGP